MADPACIMNFSTSGGHYWTAVDGFAKSALSCKCSVVVVILLYTSMRQERGVSDIDPKNYLKLLFYPAPRLFERFLRGLEGPCAAAFSLGLSWPQPIITLPPAAVAHVSSCEATLPHRLLTVFRQASCHTASTTSSMSMLIRENKNGKHVRRRRD